MVLLRHPGRLFVVLVLFAAAAVLLLQPAGLTLMQSRTAAIVMVTLALWATGTLPEYLTGLLFFLAALLLHIAEPADIFAGFASAAFWLIFIGFNLIRGIKIRHPLGQFIHIIGTGYPISGGSALKPVGSVCGMPPWKHRSPIFEGNGYYLAPHLGM